MKRKKILHIFGQLPGRTGSGIFLQALIREGFKKGYEQGVIVGVPHDYGKDVFLTECNVDFFSVEFETQELPFPVVGMSDTMPYRSTKYIELTEEMLTQWKVAFERKVIEAVQQFKPEYIICHHLWLLTALVVEQINEEIPIAAICHGTDIRQLQQVNCFAEEVIHSCSKLKSVFALSNHQKEEIILHYGIQPEKIIVTGGGFRADLFYRGESKEKHENIRIVYAGKLSDSKGVLSLIRAFECVDGDDCELYIIGSGKGEEEVRIKEAGQSSRKKIIFTGEVIQAQLADIFRASDIFVLPSFYEGLSLVLIEALASGLRVVSSELPGLKEWLGEDICESGVIKFVELPLLVEVDKPLKSELLAFEEKLRKAIVLQREKILAKDPINEQLIDKNIMKISWENIFRKIEEHF